MTQTKSFKEGVASTAVALTSLLLTAYDSVTNRAASAASFILSIIGGPRALPVHDPRKEAIAVLVTGASAAIGHSVVISLLEQGYIVFSGVRTVEDGLKIEKEWTDEQEKVPAQQTIRRKGKSIRTQSAKTQEEEEESETDPNAQARSRLIPVILDVTVDKQIKSAVELVDQTLQALNAQLVGLVNVAGSLALSPMALAEPDILNPQFDVNYFGVMKLTQAFLPHLKRSKGRIINIGSVASFVVAPGVGPYSSSKAALAAATEALRMELRPSGIGVSLVEPGCMRTRAWDRGVGALDKFAAGKAGPNVVGIDTTKTYLTGSVMEKTQTAGGPSESRDVVWCRQDPGVHVTQQVEHALQSAYPRPKYLAGIDAKVAATASNFVPTPVMEYFYKLLIRG
ncbi:hypothetical protein HDV00_003882 [Rhizophlyctis rosea]|nr:hypothetical protein HDV00_003882 [Rhizophlyctis rosea]